MPQRIDPTPITAPAPFSTGSFLTQPPRVTTTVPTPPPAATTAVVNTVPETEGEPAESTYTKTPWLRGPGDTFDGYGRTLYKFLAADYKGIRDPQPVAVRNQLDALIARPGAPSSWEDVYLLERGLYAVMPETTLRARLPFLRREFKNSVSSDDYQSYMQSSPPEIKSAPIDQLREHALALVDQIHWQDVTQTYFEELRSYLLRRQVIVSLRTLGIVIAVLILMSFLELPDFMGLLPGWLGTLLNIQFSFDILVAAVCGFAGGTFSSIQRLQALPLTGADVSNLKELEGRNIAFMVSPFIAGMSAMLFFYLSAANLLPGDLFPHFKSIYPAESEASDDLIKSLHLFASFSAVSIADAGKLVVWSFIAGFSERLIPDTISRLSAKLSD